jgi:cytochrome c553
MAKPKKPPFLIGTIGLAILGYVIFQFPPISTDATPQSNPINVSDSEATPSKNNEATITTITTSTPSTSTPSPIAPTPTILGKKLYSSLGCASCHGAGGNSKVPMFPILAGKDATYLVKQLKDFQSGARPSPMMKANAVKTKGNEQEIADYLASQ